jgi:hypothetical protein
MMIYPELEMIMNMNEQEKVSYIFKKTEQFHNCYGELEGVLGDIVKSIERMIDHHMNADLVKVEGDRALEIIQKYLEVWHCKFERN